MTNEYNLVNDLTQKLSTYSRYADFQHCDYNIKLKAASINLICELLLNSSLRCSKLTRSVVADLLKGEVSWPKEDGSFQNIKSTVTVGELEELHLIRFVRDELEVVGKVNVVQELSDKAKNMIQALNALYEIRWGRNGLLRNELVLDVAQVNSIITSNHLAALNASSIEDIDFLQLEKDGKYGLSLSHDLIKPIGTALWPLILDECKNGKDALDQWLHNMSYAFDYSDIIQLGFVDKEHEDIFLEAATKLILDEPYFHNSWSDEAHKLMVERNRGQIFYCSQTIINLSIGDDRATSSEPHEKTVPLDVQSLKSLNHSDIETPATLFSAFLWWSKADHICGRSTDFGQIYYGLTHLIIRHEKQLYNPSDSFKRVQLLLDACLDRPGIAETLLNSINAPALICYLLRRKKTSAVAMLRIASDQNLPSHQMSSTFDYQDKWRSMIWRQSLDIFFCHFQSLFGEEQYIEAANEIFSLLHALSTAVFSPGRGMHISKAKAYLMEALAFLEQAKFKQYSNAHRQPLLQSILYLLPDIITKYFPSESGEIPYAEWYLLFWCQEKFYWHSSGPVEYHDVKQLPPRISEIILASYLRVLQERLAGAGFSLDADSTFDQLNWAMLFAEVGEPHKSSLIYALNGQSVDIKLKEESEAGRKKISAIRMHVRVLLTIYFHLEDHNGSDALEIAQELVSICSIFGFSSDGLAGIFDTINDDPNTFYGVYLWEKFSAAANWFDDTLFQRQIKSAFKAKPSVKSVLTFYKETVSETRRKLIFERFVSDLDISEEKFFTITEIRDATIIAANSDMPSLAETLLELGKGHAHKAFQAEWAELEFKIALQNIYKDQSISVSDRSARISEKEIPAEAYNTVIANDPSKQNLDRYRRFLQALLLFETEPLKCYQWLNTICAESSEPLFASNRFSAHIRFIEKDLKDDDKPLAYKKALTEWDDESRKFPNHTLNLHETSLLLTCYCSLNDVTKFSELWDNLPEYQQTSYELVSVRSKFLQNNNMIKEALDYLDLVMSFHKELPKEMKEVVDGLRQELLTQQNIKSRNARVYLPLATGRLSVDEARMYWNEILRLNDFEQATVFSNSSLPQYQLEQFVIENVVMVSKELLLRSSNLLRLISNAKKQSQSIEEEDIINDWFVSLLEQRMNYLCWSVADQKRTGRSASGKSIGETDGWVSNGRNNRLFIIEAFRLFSLDTTTIDEHLDKLAGYDSIGCSPSVVIAYCFCADFNTLCSSYTKHLGVKQYKGFDVSDLSPVEKRFETVETAANIRVYREIRSRNAEPVILYHALLSFKE